MSERSVGEWRGNVLAEFARRVKGQGALGAMLSAFIEDLNRLLAEMFSRIRRYAETKAQEVATADVPVDLKQAGSTIKQKTRFIDIPTTNGSSDVLEFVLDGDGGALQLKAADDDDYGIFWEDGAWVIKETPVGIAGIEVKNGGSQVVEAATFLNLPSTNGTSSLLEFAASGEGADLRLKAGASTGQIIQWNGTAWELASLPHTVKVSDDDTTPGFLGAKLAAGTGITLSVTDDGADEKITIASTGGTITVQNAGSNEATGVTTLNLPSTLGTSGILEWEDAGSGVANLKFKTVSGQYKVLQYNGSSIVWDWVRGH